MIGKVMMTPTDNEPTASEAEAKSSDNTAQIVVDRLVAWGVKTIFGVIGEGINPLIEALRERRDEIRFIAARHEESAAFMASGHAKHTGTLGVCIATGGPGAIHLLNGLYDARFDHAPVLAITGLPVHDLIGSGFLQDVDSVALMQDVARFNLALNGPQHALTMVDLACRVALSHSCVSHLAVPKDVQLKKLGKDEASPKRGHLRGISGPVARVELPSDDQLDEAASILNAASKPMILAGRGAVGAGAELIQLAELLGAPIAKALLGMTSIDDDSSYTTCGIGDLGTMPSKEAAAECDTLLILGSTMPYLKYYPAPGQATCIQIDREPSRIGLRHPINLGLCGDVKKSLEKLIPRIQRNENRKFLATAQSAMEAWRKKTDGVEEQKSTPLKPQFVVSHVSRLLDANASISIDTGAHTIFCARHLRFREGHSLAVSGTLASMGPAMPFAIAAKLAFPDRQCVALAGDGGFTMLMGDLVTAVKYKAAIKVVVFKNNSLAQDAWEQKEVGQPEYGAELEPIDFVAFARACGAKGFRCNHPDEVAGTLKEAFQSQEVCLIEMNVDAQEWPVKPEDV